MNLNAELLLCFKMHTGMNQHFVIHLLYTRSYTPWPTTVNRKCRHLLVVSHEQNKLFVCMLTVDRWKYRTTHNQQRKHVMLSVNTLHTVRAHHTLYEHITRGTNTPHTIQAHHTLYEQTTLRSQTNRHHQPYSISNRTTTVEQPCSYKEVKVQMHSTDKVHEHYQHVG